MHSSLRYVTKNDNGDLVLDGEGEVVDWLVEMARFDEDTLFAVGHMGFGRAGVLGLTPHTLGEHQRAHSTDFWIHLLDRMFHSEETFFPSRFLTGREYR